MLHYVYILYSKKLNKYYVGETSSLESRIELHRSAYFKKAYTKRSNDWILYHAIVCNDRTIARKIEAHIKRMKSSNYIENLKRYPEMSKKLVERYGRGS